MASLLAQAGYKTSDEEKQRQAEEQAAKQKVEKDKQRARKAKENTGLVPVLSLDYAPHAPYNFVPVKDKVMEAPVPAGLGRISDVFYSGRIHYHMESQTPIFVGGQGTSFYHNPKGQYAIPGSSIRGLVRSHVQLLSFSSIGADVDDYKLMYRAVAGGIQRKEYADILGQSQKTIGGHRLSVLEKVKAGYVSCEAGEYYYYKHVGDRDGRFAQEEANYYPVSERWVLENCPEKFRDILKCFQHLNTQKEKFKRSEKNGHVHYRGTENKGYAPYFRKITYSLADNNRVSGIANEGLDYDGYVLSSGKMSEKKVFYVIPEVDKDTKEKLPSESVLAFRVDYNRKKNGVSSFFDLPQEGEIRPAFYIEDANRARVYFGYTPRLRLMYEHSVKEGLRQEELAKGTCDYAQAMFGYADAQGARKSRVYCTDATLKSEESAIGSKKVILSEPKPTSYLEYLEQEAKKPPYTYNTEGMRLRGVKQYWLHESPNEGKASDNEQIKSEICPLDNATFAGEIRFHQLSKDELGLLLWSIRLEKDSQLNIGKAKPYGYGRMKISDLWLELEDYPSAYSATVDAFTTASMQRKDDLFIQEAIDTYQQRLARWLSPSEQEVMTKESAKDMVMKEPTIRDFFAMRAYQGSGRTVEYMHIDKVDDRDNFSWHKQRHHALPTVQQIVNNSEKK